FHNVSESFMDRLQKSFDPFNPRTPSKFQLSASPLKLNLQEVSAPQRLICEIETNNRNNKKEHRRQEKKPPTLHRLEVFIRGNRNRSAREYHTEHSLQYWMLNLMTVSQNNAVNDLSRNRSHDLRAGYFRYYFFRKLYSAPFPCSTFSHTSIMRKTLHFRKKFAVICPTRSS